MQIQKKELVRHLKSLYTGGQIEEAVLDGAFASSAVTTDHVLLVIAPQIEKVEPLTEEVGVIDLGLLIKSLEVFGEDDDDVVDFQVEDHRIVLSHKDQGVVRLVTGEQIATRLAPDNLAQITAYFTGKPVPMPQTLVEGILKSISLLKADEVIVSVTTKGTEFQVGNSQSNFGTFSLKGHKAGKKADEYTLHLSSRIFFDVLSQIHDYTQSEIQFAGPESFVMVACSGYQYIISPEDPPS